MFFKFAIVICALVALQVESGPLQARNSTDKGVIYSRPTGACLEASWEQCPGSTMLSLHTVGACPFFKSENQFKFEENGQISVIQNGERKCLDCFHYRENCHLITFNCHDGINQRYFLRTYPSQIDWTNKRFYFSIHIEQFPKKCLTAYHDYYNVQFDEQQSRNLEATNKLSEVRRNGDQFQGIHHGFRLEECRGFPNQSFYFEKSWTDDVDKFIDEYEEREVNDHANLTH